MKQRFIQVIFVWGILASRTSAILLCFKQHNKYSIFFPNSNEYCDASALLLSFFMNDIIIRKESQISSKKKYKKPFLAKKL